MINYSNTHSNSQSNKRSSKHRNPQHHPSSRQSGGTLLGIIIGLIVGLGIALAVAITITKTSLPFLNKQGKEKAVELTPGQASDPNRPLYGSKEAAREAAKDFAKSAAEPAAPAEIMPAPADKPVAVKPLVIKPAETKEAAPAKAENADDKWAYYLQAGAFREQADAESTRAKLALAGFEASISERPADSSGGTLYRVRLGPFNQLEAMNRVRSKLSDNGVDVAVVRIAK